MKLSMYFLIITAFWFPFVRLEEIGLMQIMAEVTQ